MGHMNARTLPLGFSGLGFRVQGLGFSYPKGPCAQIAYFLALKYSLYGYFGAKVYTTWVHVLGLGLRVVGIALRVQGSILRVWGSGGQSDNVQSGSLMRAYSKHQKLVPSLEPREARV